MPRERESLQKLYLEQLRDLYSAEEQILEALPKMADAANDPVLKGAFREHLEQTRQHVQRLEQIFRSAGKEPERETCDGIKGLLKEGSEMLKMRGEPEAKDAGLIAAAQRVEHYEMAVYGTIRNYAQSLGRNEFADLLQRTLNEEGEADKKLTQIAERKVNPKAETAAH